MYVPFNYGPGGDASKFNGNFTSNGYPTAIGSHVLVLESNQNYDAVNQFKLQGTWTEDHLRIRGGVQYLVDHENLKYYGDFNNSDWQAYAGYGPANNNTGAPLNPAWFTGRFSTSGFLNGKSGTLPGQILQFNPTTVLNYLQSLSLPNPYFNAGCNCTYAADGKYAYPLGSRDDIKEETLSAFVDFAFDAEVADRPIKVDFGLREDHTRMEASGLGHTLTALGTPASSDPTNYITYGLNDPPVTLTKGNNYNYLLPNLDVGYFLTPKLKLRFDASRTLTKPLLADLKPELAIDTTRLNALTAHGGNPSLLPYLSDNVDFGAEWYYQKNSYLSADFFVKDISNFIASGVYTTTFPGVYLPPAADATYSNHGTQGTSATGPAAVFSVTSKLNEGAYQVRGVELTAQHVFGETGFGFLANVTMVDTNKPYNPANTSNNVTVVPGLANSWNVIGFYDKYGFQARIAINHHDDELLQLGQHQNVSNFGAEPTFLSAATYVDFSTSYQINPHLDVYFEALNLTDQIYETHGRYAEQILDQVDTGRRFNLGAHFKF
jgi:TonB-dependent receptor